MVVCISVCYVSCYGLTWFICRIYTWFIVRQDNMVLRDELIEADINDMSDLEKRIILFMYSIPKPKHENILDEFKKEIDWEDLSDTLRGWVDDGILFKNYGYYEFTSYGNELINKVKSKGE